MLNKYTQKLNEVKVDDFSPLPNGKYFVQVKECDVKRNKNNTGDNFSVVFKVMQGEYADRIIYDNIVLSNPSQVATEIGLKALKALAAAIDDKADFNGIDEFFFIDKILVIDVGLKPAGNGYDAKNVVKGYSNKSVGLDIQQKTNGAEIDKDITF